MQISNGAKAGCLFIGILAATFAINYYSIKNLKIPIKIEKTDPALVQIHDVLYYRNDPFSGIVIEHYLNGALYRESQYDKGKKESLEKEYALNGVLRASWNYHNGKKNGLQQGWYAEGPKRFEYYYDQGLLDGVQTEWHQNGVVFKRQVFKQGVETEKKILYQGSEIFTNYSKRSGRIYGLDGGTLCFEVKKEGEK